MTEDENLRNLDFPRVKRRMVRRNRTTTVLCINWAVETLGVSHRPKLADDEDTRMV